MVFGWNNKQVVKKKYTAESKDKKDWISFTKKMENISVKEADFIYKDENKTKVPLLDLHGFSLGDANIEVEKFIIQSYNDGYGKILIITGKGSRSKSYENPYLSEKLSVLKHAVPEYIDNNENLTRKIKKILTADKKDGGDGAIYVFLKNKRT